MKKSLLAVLAVVVCGLTLAPMVEAGQPDDSNSQEMNTKLASSSVNLRVFVPELFVGYVGGVWDIAVSRAISLGPIARVFVFGKYSGYDFGLNMNYSLRGNIFRTGFLLNPYVEYYRANYEQPLNDFGNRPKVSTVVAGMNLMHQWMFHDGFNIMLGLGVEYANEIIPVTMIGNGHFHLHYEVTIGYAF